MDTTAEAQPVAGPEGRMWRKVVAFRRDQEAALKGMAAALPGEDAGNVSAVIRDAVDEYITRHQNGGQANG